jgi:hypothetical protein
MSNILEEPYDGRLSRKVLREGRSAIPFSYSTTNRQTPVSFNNKNALKI